MFVCRIVTFCSSDSAFSKSSNSPRLMRSRKHTRVLAVAVQSVANTVDHVWTYGEDRNLIQWELSVLGYEFCSKRSLKLGDHIISLSIMSGKLWCLDVARILLVVDCKVSV